jgi:hypothetical protein
MGVSFPFYSRERMPLPERDQANSLEADLRERRELLERPSALPPTRLVAANDIDNPTI